MQRRSQRRPRRINVIFTKRNPHEGVAVFTLSKGGLMAEASIGGQKFSFEPFARRTWQRAAEGSPGPGPHGSGPFSHERWPRAP